MVVAVEVNLQQPTMVVVVVVLDIIKATPKVRHCKPMGLGTPVRLETIKVAQRDVAITVVVVVLEVWAKGPMVNVPPMVVMES